LRGLDLFPDTQEVSRIFPIFQDNSLILGHYQNALRHYNLVSVLVSVGDAALEESEQSRASASASVSVTRGTRTSMPELADCRLAP
jgi:hypothetical protein